MSNKFFTLLGFCLALFLVACSTSTPTPLLNTPSLPENTSVPVVPTATKTMDIPASGVLAFYSDRDGNPEIYSMNADGSGLMRLTNDPGFDDSPEISPDGRRIVFLTARHDPQPRFPNLKYEIYTMDIDGSNVKQLTFELGYDGGAFFSPDGTKLVFRSSRPKTDAEIKEYKDLLDDGLVMPTNMEIYVCNVDGSDLKKITEIE